MDIIGERVIDGLRSLALEEFNLLHDLQDDKMGMEIALSAIKAVLLDAEANNTSDRVRSWLEKLEEILHEADDLLDDFSSEALARKVMTGTKIAKKVRIFFSKSNQVAYRHKMSHKMKEIRKKLEDIVHDENKPHPDPRTARLPMRDRERQTFSFVRQDEVFGRHEEKELIVSHLLGCNDSNDLSVVTIVGVGGLGKTCLAQLVYNDERVKHCFDLRMWVCVSDSFDIKGICQKMVGGKPNANIQQLQEEVERKISGKRFLLVLDDAWIEDRDLWLQLKSLLMTGSEGTKVIITTRIATITKITNADMDPVLKGLDEYVSWELFSRLAFEDREEPYDPELIAMLEAICKKCKGVPFTIRKMANLLYGTEVSDWPSMMNKIVEEMDDIKDDENKPLPYPRPPQADMKEKRETSSFLHEVDVFGRHEEKERIVSHILGHNDSNDLSVVTIFGVGGVGKTCLAQRVYNDERVKHCFELQMWVCVSDSFDFREIAQKMVGGKPNANIQQLQNEVERKIEGKRFLLVLDDVWSENRLSWLQLKSTLMFGGNRSMVIITTRNEMITKIADADKNLVLKRLDMNTSWMLFRRLAFEKGEEPNDPKLVAMGKEICKKCEGIPLAIKTMANLLYSTNISDWPSIMENELLSRNQASNNILDILRLSYDQLPSNLKNCFAYCSLFPRDFEIDKKTLIQLWMAQGFIPLADENSCPEDVGHEYFLTLLSRSFFQNANEDEFGGIKSCKMLRTMHDLATLVSKNEYVIIREENKEIIRDRVRHLFMDIPWGFVWKVQTSFLEQRKLRTYFLPRGAVVWEKSLKPSGCYGRRGGWSRWVACNWGKFRTAVLAVPWRLECLRVLCNPFMFLPIIPKSIGELKHLRYLDLSGNSIIKELPRSITRLHNLQTLKLNDCASLEELPRNINKMVSLRHLELDGCSCLSWMPQRLGQLTSLQTMTQFRMNPRKSDSARLRELGGLNNLKGRLSICDLRHVRGKVGEVVFAKLFQKQHLQELELYWGASHGDLIELEEVHYEDERILQALEPHCSIKSLKVSGFFIKMLPHWMGNLSSLQVLCLDTLNFSGSTPDDIGILTSLRRLEMTSCSDLTSLPESMGNLSSLQKLKIKCCDFLESLPESMGKLSSLQQLEINSCKLLASLPKSIGDLSSLQELKIHGCDDLASLPEGMRDIKSLQRLRIAQCPQLQERCKEGGEDWQKIAHVPIVSFTP